MRRKSKKSRLTISFLYFITGVFVGFISIWPGLVTNNGRECFYRIIKDGSDGNVTIGTIFSITPNYLLKIKNAQNKYFKVLLIGDFCFRRL
tara:strand:+ start:422 stop:694 length:273 start_codon:yes stop_codon:yes gene_type:complete